MRQLLLVSLAIGCHRSSPGEDAPVLIDTGWFTTDSGPVDPENCPDQFVTTAPEDGETGWYWHDRPTLFTRSAHREGYQAWLQTEDGERLPTAMVWDEVDGLSFTLEWEGHLEADTTYLLGLEDCARATTVTFTTSSLGDPLDEPPGALVGNTYLLDLVGAEWVQPSALSGILQQYFNTPILLGIQYANQDSIRLVGAPGEIDDLGNVTQDSSASIWNFPLADFSGAPYVDVAAPRISFQYAPANDDPIEVPVEDFVLTATLSSDGTLLGGGVLAGLGDSRYLGAELLGGPSDLCVFATGLGVPCVPCADGEPYCLQLVARDLEATLLPDLVIEQPDPG